MDRRTSLLVTTAWVVIPKVGLVRGLNHNTTGHDVTFADSQRLSWCYRQYRLPVERFYSAQGQSVCLN
jgi:hypothetical protein